MKFGVICADSPWSFSDKLEKMKSPTKRSAISQYQTMSVSQLQKLDVPSLVDPSGCVLALWVPSTLLIDGISVMHAWGFSLKQTYVWVKTKKDPLKTLRKNVLAITKRGEASVDEIERSFDDFSCSETLAFGMGRLMRQSHEIALVGTFGKSIYQQLKNKSQRSVSFSHNAGHSIKPETLQDSLDLMFPVVNKLELFARRVRPGWTCVGDGVTGKDIIESIHDLANDVKSNDV